MTVNVTRNLSRPMVDSNTLLLPPVLHPLVRGLIEEHELLIAELLRGCGSPLHLVLPQIFTENVQRFSAALRDAGVQGHVLFAKKANKARCFIEHCVDLGVGIDAASSAEVSQALDVGIAGERIGISGPAKALDLLHLAVRQRCLVAVDSIDELQGFVKLAQEVGIRARALLRLRPTSQPFSRFGMSDTECREALRLCVAARPHLALEGFSFHLSGYSPTARGEMAHRLINYCIEGRGLNLECNTINIGGGFAVRYVEEAPWQTFLATQSAPHYHAGKTFEGFYPYFSHSSGAAMLAEVLATPENSSAFARSVARRCASHAIRLLIEPGRALLDQAGFSAFRIQGLKDRERTEGYGIITADGTSFSLSEQWFNSEFLPDPLLLGITASDGLQHGYAACVGGASCLDADMLTWRKVRLPRKPQVGEVLIYVNTAGYQMDSNESPFHDRPLPTKVVVTMTDGRPAWRLDGVRTPARER